MDCGSFSVCLIDEHFECEYIYRDFLLQSTEVSSSCWPIVHRFSLSLIDRKIMSYAWKSLPALIGQMHVHRWKLLSTLSTRSEKPAWPVNPMVRSSFTIYSVVIERVSFTWVIVQCIESSFSSSHVLCPLYDDRPNGSGRPTEYLRAG